MIDRVEKDSKQLHEHSSCCSPKPNEIFIRFRQKYNYKLQKKNGTANITQNRLKFSIYRFIFALMNERSKLKSIFSTFYSSFLAGNFSAFFQWENWQSKIWERAKNFGPRN